jgi:hypothetical protein
MAGEYQEGYIDSLGGPALYVRTLFGSGYSRKVRLQCPESLQNFWARADLGNRTECWDKLIHACFSDITRIAYVDAALAQMCGM